MKPLPPHRVVHSAMRVRLHLKPGQKGTKRLLEEYGERLVCVRYRYDAARGERFKTVELIVSKRDWRPRRRSFTNDQVVALRIAFAEVAMRTREASGWNVEPGSKALGDPRRSGGCGRIDRSNRRGASIQ